MPTHAPSGSPAHDGLATPDQVQGRLSPASRGGKKFIPHREFIGRREFIALLGAWAAAAAVQPFAARAQQRERRAAFLCEPVGIGKRHDDDVEGVKARSFRRRHARPCAGHPRLVGRAAK
jgi:hypothetical protein